MRHESCMHSQIWHIDSTLFSSLRYQAEPLGSQGTQTRGAWDVCIDERCSTIKKQTIYAGPVKVITDPFFLEGVLHSKLTDYVSIAVSTRMTFPWHQQWSVRSMPCLVYCRDEYWFAVILMKWVMTQIPPNDRILSEYKAYTSRGHVPPKDLARSNEHGFAETLPGEKGLSTISSGWNELEIEVFVSPDAPRLALPAPPAALALNKSTCLLQAYQWLAHLLRLNIASLTWQRPSDYVAVLGELKTR